MSMEVSLVIKAVDEASEIIKRVSEETAGALNEVKEASERVAAAHQLSWKESKNLLVGFSQIATGAFNLYNLYDRVSDSQLNLHRAQLQVQQALNALEDAQNRYNKAVEKYGETSPQAQAALRDLQLAQERYNYALERAEMIQQNFNELIVQSALQVLPTFITIMDGVKKAKEAWTAAQWALNAAMNACPIMLIVTAVGALVAILVTAYNTCEPFRNAVNALGETLANFFKPILDAIIGAFTWLWQNVLEPLANFIVAIFVTNIRVLCAVLEWLNNNIVKPLSDAFSWLYNNVLKPVGDFIVSYHIAQWKALGAVYEWLNNNVVKPLSDAFSWFYNNVLKPIGDFIAGYFVMQWRALGAVWEWLKGAWDAFCGALQWGYNTFIKPIVDALTWFYNNVLKPIGDFFGGVGAAIHGAFTAAGGLLAGVPAFQHGGIVTKPTLALLGEAGPEAVIPLEHFSPAQIVNINAPLVYVEGSADKRTAELAAELIREKLKTVLIEATSRSAPTKRIVMPKVM